MYFHVHLGIAQQQGPKLKCHAPEPGISVLFTLLLIILNCSCYIKKNKKTNIGSVSLSFDSKEIRNYLIK